MYMCMYVHQVLVEAHVQWNNELEQVLLLGSITVSFNPSQ